MPASGDSESSSTEVLKREEQSRWESAEETGRSIGGTLYSDAWETLEREGYVREYVRLIDEHLDDGARLLDLACGDGKGSRDYLREGSRTGIDVVGVDIARDGFLEDWAGPDEQGEFVVGDADRLPFETGSFDLVLGRAALHHIPGWEGQLLEEVRRVLDDDGAFVFVDPLRYNPFALAFRLVFESRHRTDAEVPLDPFALEDQLARAFYDVELQGHYVVSPIVAMLDRVLPVSTTEVALATYRAERTVSDDVALPIAGEVTGIARYPR